MLSKVCDRTSSGFSLRKANLYAENNLSTNFKSIFSLRCDGSALDPMDMVVLSCSFDFGLAPLYTWYGVIVNCLPTWFSLWSSFDPGNSSCSCTSLVNASGGSIRETSGLPGMTSFVKLIFFLVFFHCLSFRCVLSISACSARNY